MWTGVILDTSCMRYPHPMPFLNFVWHFLSPKTLNLLTVYGGFIFKLPETCQNMPFFVYNKLIPCLSKKCLVLQISTLNARNWKRVHYLFELRKSLLNSQFPLKCTKQDNLANICLFIINPVSTNVPKIDIIKITWKVHLLMLLVSLLSFISSIWVEINANYLQKICFYFLHFSDSLKILKKRKLYLQLQRRHRHGKRYQETFR